MAPASQRCRAASRVSPIDAATGAAARTAIPYLGAVAGLSAAAEKARSGTKVTATRREARTETRTPAAASQTAVAASDRLLKRRGYVQQGIASDRVQFGAHGEHPFKE